MRHTSVTLLVSDVVLSCDVSLYLIFVETTQTCFPARFRRLIVSSLCVVVCVFVDRVVSNTACVTCASLSSCLRFLLVVLFHLTKKGQGSIQRYVTALSRHVPVTLASVVVSSLPVICFPVGPIMDCFSAVVVQVSLPLPEDVTWMCHGYVVCLDKRTIWFSLVPIKLLIGIRCAALYGSCTDPNTDVICGLIYGSLCVHI